MPKLKVFYLAFFLLYMFYACRIWHVTIFFVLKNGDNGIVKLSVFICTLYLRKVVELLPLKLSCQIYTFLCTV